VVTLPNPFHWQFLLAANKSGIAGDLVAEGQGLRRVLNLLVQRGTLRQGRSFKKVTLVGYSAGGFYAAVLGRELKESPSPDYKITQSILLNPPVSFSEPTQKIDELFEVGASFGQLYRDTIVGRGITLMQDGLSEDLSLEGLSKLFTPPELLYLIGYQFRLPLVETLFAHSLIRPELNLLSVPYSKYYRNARMKEASQISFTQYLKQVVLKYVYSDNLKKYEEESQLAHWLDGQNNVEIIHSKNDPLIPFDHVTQMLAVMSAGDNDRGSSSGEERVAPVLIPIGRGGHLGYLLKDSFLKLLHSRLN